MRPTLLAATLLLAPVAALADAPAGIAFDHQDWTIACDNTRTCRAAGYQPG
ncbi:invasion protein IalB [Xanthomonas arboricola]|nr:invasion protein IalB [Xanthomonas euroxanthea]NJC35981.1 invasion protein IalB [Xanthomonas euroxanthea]